MDESECDILHLLDRVPILLRLLQLICSAVVASCLLGNVSAMPVFSVDFCNYGIVLGFLSIVLGLGAIGGTVCRHRLGYLTTRRTMTIELAIDIIFSVMWFAAFITLTVKWAQLGSLIPGDIPLGWIRSNFQAAVAFAFFAFLFQAALTFVSFLTVCDCLYSGSSSSSFDVEDAIETGSSNETIQNRLTLSKVFVRFNIFMVAGRQQESTAPTSNYQSIGN